MQKTDAPNSDLNRAIRTMRVGDMRPPVCHPSKRLGFQLQLTGPNQGCWMRVSGLTDDEQYTLDFNRGYFAEQLGVNPIDMVVHLDQMTSTFDAWFRTTHPRRSAWNQLWFRWLGIDRLDLQVDGMPTPPGPLPVTLKEELDRTPNLSANDVLHAFERIEDRARSQQITWETGDILNEVIQKLAGLHRRLDPLGEEGFYYVQYNKKDLDDLLRSYKVMPDRVISPCFDPDDERSLKALLGDYFVNRLEIFDPAQVLNAIQRTTSIVIPDKLRDEFIQGPTSFELGDLDVVGFIDTLKKPAVAGTFVYSQPQRVEVEVGAEYGGIGLLDPSQRQFERREIGGAENTAPGVEAADKNVARANALMLEKLEMRVDEVGISGPTEERLVWAANEVMSMIGKEEFLSLYAHECRGSRFFKHKPRYLETRINLNWSQQVETRVSYHQIAELIARVEAKMHPSTQQKGGTPMVNTAPAAIRPGKRPTLIVDQYVLQYSWFSPDHEARALNEICAGLQLRGRSVTTSDDMKKEAESTLSNVKMAFQVWFFHELGHLVWLGPGRLSRMLNLDEKDERERIIDCVDLLMPALQDWDLIATLDLFSRNREVAGIRVIRAKPKDKVFTTYRNDLRMAGGNDSPYYRTISNYYDLARQRRQIDTQTTTLKVQQDLISRSPKGFDREALQKDYVIKHVELEKLQARFNDKVSTMVKASMDRKCDLRLMQPGPLH